MFILYNGLNFLLYYIQSIMSLIKIRLISFVVLTFRHPDEPATKVFSSQDGILPTLQKVNVEKKSSDLPFELTKMVRGPHVSNIVGE